MSNVKRPLEPQKTAIVIGASAGLGAALVRALVKDGYKVAGVARRQDKLETLASSLNASADSDVVLTYTHDVTNYDEAPALFQTITRDLGSLDLIIYNAGVMPQVALHEYNFDKDKAMIDVNVSGAIAWLNQAAQRFEREKNGHIVGIGSIAGDRGRVGAPVYNTSKAALATYLEALRNRLTRHGVAVTTIKPGMMETDMLEHVTKRLWVIEPEEAADTILNAIKRKKQTLYVPARWGLMGLVIRNIPSFIFRKLSI